MFLSIMLAVAAFATVAATEEVCPNRQAVLAHLTFIESQLKSTEKPLSPLSCYSYGNMIRTWQKKFKFIELETEIDSSWFNKVAEFLTYIGKCKDEMATLKDAKKERSKDYRQLEENLDTAIQRFDELLKKPYPPDKKKLEKLRAEKRKYDTEKRREQAKKTGIIMPSDDE